MLHFLYTGIKRLKAVAAALLIVGPPCFGQAYDKSVPEPTVKEARYGDHNRQVMDAWLVEGDSPSPVVVVIHGGGWKGGSKELVHRFADVSKLLDAGISVVAINYRLIKEKEDAAADQAIDTSRQPPVHKPLHDAARAVQFVRSKAKEWNIDPDRIGAAGGSAGACSSLWLAFHDDLAKKDSDDPVARQSTRLQCAAVMGAQTTLDPAQMKAWTPNSKYGAHAFGLPSFNAFLDRREDILPWIKAYSPYHHVSKDDPPIYLRYFAKPGIGKRQGDPTHTSNFGLKLQELCQTKGVACELFYPGMPDAKHQDNTAFLITTFKTK